MGKRQLLAAATLGGALALSAAMTVAVPTASAKPAAAHWQRLIDGGVDNDQPKRLLVLDGGALLLVSEHQRETYRTISLTPGGKVGPSQPLAATVDDLHPSTLTPTTGGGAAGGSFGPRVIVFDKQLKRTLTKTYPAFQPEADGNFLIAFLAQEGGGTYTGLAQSQHHLVRFALDKTGVLTAQLQVAGDFAGLNGLGGTALLEDGSLVVTGDTHAANGDGDGDDVRVVRIDPAGKIAWDQAYGGTKMDYGVSVAGTADGGIVVGGGTRSSGGGALAWYVLKLDGHGKKLWEKTFGGAGNDFLIRAVQVQNGGIVLGGTIAGQLTLIKLDAAGNEQWRKAYGPGVLQDLTPLADDGIAFAAVRPLPGGRRLGTLVVRTDATGEAGPAPAPPKPAAHK